jgi:hypothetical protein
MYPHGGGDRGLRRRARCPQRRRLDTTGARWSLPGAEAILLLRAVIDLTLSGVVPPVESH